MLCRFVFRLPVSPCGDVAVTGTHPPSPRCSNGCHGSKSITLGSRRRRGGKEGGRRTRAKRERGVCVSLEG